MKKMIWFLVAAFVLIGVAAYDVQEADAFPSMGANCSMSGCHDGVARALIPSQAPAPTPAPTPAPAPAPKPAPAPAPAPAKPAPAPAPVKPAGPVVANGIDFKLFGVMGKVDVAVIDGDVYVGIRSAAKAVGADLSYDAATKQVVAKATYSLNKTYAFELKAKQGEKGISVNGTPYILSHAIKNVNGNLYVRAHCIANVASARSGTPLTVTLVKNVLEIK